MPASNSKKRLLRSFHIPRIDANGERVAKVPMPLVSGSCAVSSRIQMRHARAKMPEQDNPLHALGNFPELVDGRELNELVNTDKMNV